MLTTQSLTVMRQQKTLLHNINVTIDKGKIYALIGHNGSGKSTLIKALAGETPPPLADRFYYRILLTNQSLIYRQKPSHSKSPIYRKNCLMPVNLPLPNW